MKTFYNKLINKIFSDAYPKYQVSTDELGEQPILSPNDWKVLVTSEPPKRKAGRIPDKPQSLSDIA